MFTLLETNPGVVVLHDFFLSGVRHFMDATNYAPRCFSERLYKSHGYKGLSDLAEAKDVSEVIWAYPSNLDVLEGGVGTIVHSANSIRLANHWYDPTELDCEVIPLVRGPAAEIDKLSARKALGISDEDFVVCAFGIIGFSKLNHRLLDSWLDSALPSTEKCHLFFVGENDPEKYGKDLLDKVLKHPKGNTVRITGWLEHDTYKKYLAAADLGVQLRTLSRGETSAAVMDCMNYGLPTIVNANGSMADLPDDSVMKLPDDFTKQELIEALESMWLDDALRKKIGLRAKKVILEQHNPAHCAKKYRESIENFYKGRSPVVPSLLANISCLPESDWSDDLMRDLSTAIAGTFPVKHIKKSLFIDVSELVQRDAKSGIQRVVRSILREWLLHPPPGYRIEPVYATETKMGYRYARKFTHHFLGVGIEPLPDDLIEYSSADMFLCLDLQPKVQVAQREFFKTLRRQGIKVKFVVYDLLCVLQSEHFVPGASKDFCRWLDVVFENDGAVCISKSVADELAAWQNSNVLTRKSPFPVGWFHLGADIEESIPTKGLPDQSNLILKQIDKRTSFLMVGTLEPRKGHIQALEAFELLWEKKQDLNLVIVGKQGWMTEELVSRLRKHPELNKHLFWFESSSDEFLVKLYKVSSCLIAASYGEGFGLPLIEAAQHKIPIIARDIPVFREVAGSHAFYFSGNMADDLSESIKNWLSQHAVDEHPKSDKIHWLTWKEAANNLFVQTINGY